MKVPDDSRKREETENFKISLKFCEHNWLLDKIKRKKIMYTNFLSKSQESEAVKIKKLFRRQPSPVLVPVREKIIFEETVKLPDEDQIKPIITFKRLSKKIPNQLCSLLEIKGILENNNFLQPKTKSLENLDNYEQEDLKLKNNFKNLDMIDKSNHSDEGLDEDIVDLVIYDANDNVDKITCNKRTLMDTNESTSGVSRATDIMYNCIRENNTEGNIVQRAWRATEPPNNQLSIKHKLPLQAPSEREKYKAIKKIVIPLTRTQSDNTAQSNHRVTQVRTIDTQTDEVFLETKEDHEILEFIKTYGITMERLERCKDTNEEINNNKDDQPIHEIMEFRDRNTTVDDNILNTIISQSEENKSRISKSKPNSIQKAIMHRNRKTVSFSSNTSIKHAVNGSNLVNDKSSLRLHRKGKIIGNPDEMGSQHVHRQQQNHSVNYQPVNTENNNDEIIIGERPQPYQRNQLMMLPIETSRPRFNHLSKACQPFNVKSLPFPIRRYPHAQQNFPPQFIEGQYGERYALVQNDNTLNYMNNQFPELAEFEQQSFYPQFRLTKSELRQHHLEYLERQRIKQLDLQQRAWESRLMNYPNSAWIKTDRQ